jgi:hypothetical protein
MIRRPWNVEADMTVWIRDLAAGAAFVLFIGGAFAFAEIAQAVAAAV